ncbi:hypothetical protein NDU88_007443 [Pleurodeles waltl]|uniref:Uncharacterized protein n=1 Tax=Pleurodeles waltl TaxID=8319 RepID=A0AAV7SSA9_PLEWA|nr:hypothetical protein NDU88_007443 [Pleurodeles waltl]
MRPVGDPVASQRGASAAPLPCPLSHNGAVPLPWPLSHNGPVPLPWPLSHNDPTPGRRWLLGCLGLLREKQGEPVRGAEPRGRHCCIGGFGSPHSGGGDADTSKATVHKSALKRKATAVTCGLANLNKSLIAPVAPRLKVIKACFLPALLYGHLAFPEDCATILDRQQTLGFKKIFHLPRYVKRSSVGLEFGSTNLHLACGSDIFKYNIQILRAPAVPLKAGLKDISESPVSPRQIQLQNAIHLLQTDTAALSRDSVDLPIWNKAIKKPVQLASFQLDTASLPESEIR